MTDVGGVTGEHLRSFIERIERLQEEQRAIGADVREVFSEAKAVGFETKVMRRILALRRMDPSTRQELESLEDLYRRAVGLEPMGEEPAIDGRLGKATDLFRRGMTVRAVAAAMGISAATAGRLRQQADAAGLLVSRLTGTDETETPHDPDTGEIIERDAQSPSSRDVSTDGEPCLGDAPQGNRPMPAQDAGELAGHEGRTASAAGPDEPGPITVGNPAATLVMPDIPAFLDRRAQAAE